MKFRIVKKCSGYERYQYQVEKNYGRNTDWLFVNTFFHLEQAEDSLKSYIAMETTKDEVVKEVEI